MGRTLGRLLTDLGERSSYDAASQCSRCGYCEQACPTYVATGRESRSARGRNQLVRLIIEGKLSDPQTAREALATCLLCGACSTACYAHVPTADLVLEGRRLLQEKPSRLARWIGSLLLDEPRLLEKGLKAAYFLKRLGAARLARPFLRALGFPGVAEADAHVEQAPREFLHERLSKLPVPAAPSWIYFAPCGPNYLYPEVGLATVSVLGAARGPGRFFGNDCCGLLCYNYGGLDQARALARKNMEKAEVVDGQAPIVADCSSCAAFLKTYPQLFLGEPELRRKAERFVGRVQDAVEAFGSDQAIEAWGGPTAGGKVVYHNSCRACHGQGLAVPRRLLRGLCGGSYAELPESDVCCGGAGAFSFTQPELSDEVLKRKIGCVASVQAELVLASSTSCLIQLARGLKKYYPEGKVMHLSEFLAQRIPRDGTTTGA
ncbi:MAG: (Fe-S)-binding protein [Elusimicrobia bacterium]|nr:(Fe-S)-binding protein [Elusimicrobiota bacterium]